MSDRNQLEPVESMMVDLRGAEAGRVFQRTPVRAEQLLRPAAPASARMLWSRVGMALAACLAVAIGLGGYMFQREVQHIRLTKATQQGGQFAVCLSGPAAGDAGSCEPLDYDADGDIDLADFSEFQLALADASR